MLEKVDRDLKLMEELDLRLVKAVDTHCTPTTSPASARCATAPLRDGDGEQSNVDVVSMRIADGDRLTVEG